MKALLLIGSLALLDSCATPRLPGSYAHVSVSPAYNSSKPVTIGILPVSVEGKPDQQTDGMLSDKLSSRFLDLGFRVIDRMRVEAAAKSLGIDLTKPLSQADLTRLSNEVKVDAYVAGTQTWIYIPGHSESRPDVVQTTRYEVHAAKDKDGRMRNDTTWIHDETPTMRNSSVEGQYQPQAESIKLISASNGEVLIGGYTAHGHYDMTDEIIDAIHEYFWPTKRD